MQVSIRIYIEWEKDIRQMLIKQEKCDWDDKVTANQTRKKERKKEIHGLSSLFIHSFNIINKQTKNKKKAKLLLEANESPLNKMN